MRSLSSMYSLRLLIALVLSVILHTGLLMWTPDIKPLHKHLASNYIIQASLRSNSYTVTQTLGSPVNVIQPIEPDPVPRPREIKTNLTQATVGESTLTGYLSTRDIERKALPVSNIDISMLKGEFISGVPIRLRLYINATGRVVKIDKLAVLPQDEEFALSIENLLYQTTFLAAKKDGLDVPSYQDIEFSFSSSVK